MPPERSGTYSKRGGKYRARIRVGDPKAKKRTGVTLVGCRTDKAAGVRVEALQAFADRLFEARKTEATILDFVQRLAAAKTPEDRAVVQSLAEKTMRGAFVEDTKLRSGMTVANFAKLWTGGELRKQYPDHVPEKASAYKDVGTLRKWVLDEIGDLPLVAVDIGHIEAVMRGIPLTKASATRRHVAQVMHRLFRLAVYPAKLLEVSPLPKGFLPRITKGRVTAYLYPAEDARLLACALIPLPRRVLYGFLHREGMRFTEAVSLDWSDLALVQGGTVRLDENKTDDPRTWALEPGTARALVEWAENPWTEGSMRVFGSTRLPTKAAEQYRADLKTAGIDRPEIFAMGDRRRPIRIHDTRTAFVTIALANGRSETWVMDRTGHTTSTVLQRYRRNARTAAELGLGSWLPLDQAIPELRGLGSDRDPDDPRSSETSGNPGKSGSSRQCATHAADLKSPARKGVRVQPPEGLLSGNQSGFEVGSQGGSREGGSQTDPKRLSSPLPLAPIPLRLRLAAQLAALGART